MNKCNNCKIVENNIVESDINTTEVIVDDGNNDIEKRTKGNERGKLVVNKNNKKGFYLGRQGNNKKLGNKQKV